MKKSILLLVLVGIVAILMIGCGTKTGESFMWGKNWLTETFPNAASLSSWTKDSSKGPIYWSSPGAVRINVTATPIGSTSKMYKSFTTSSANNSIRAYISNYNGASVACGVKIVNSNGVTVANMNYTYQVSGRSAYRFFAPAGTYTVHLYATRITVGSERVRCGFDDINVDEVIAV